ncbi:MAG: hypothetical protein SFU53_06870 [Terrimicrobiaceae bacterium]|nr:hypothetical protein [Terrimicrobiaceae bacterium]
MNPSNFDPPVEDASTRSFPPKRKSADRFTSVRWVKEAKNEITPVESAEAPLSSTDTQRISAGEAASSSKPSTLFRKSPTVRRGEPDETASASTPTREESSARVVWIAASAALAFGVLAFVLGLVAGVRLAAPNPASAEKTAAPSGPAMLPAELQETFTRGLRERQAGEAGKALQTFREILKQAPTAPSVRFAAALAAIDAGETTAAQQWLEYSATEGDRAADAFAILAAITSQKTGSAAGEQERLLRNAIAADPMNPSPLVEMASLMRKRRDPVAAEGYLEAARLRLNPVDSHAVIRTTMELVRMEQTVTSRLPDPQPPTGVAEKDLLSAYVEMRRGNTPAAAALLTSARQSMDPDLYSYLISDPAMRKFALEPELVPFFE